MTQIKIALCLFMTAASVFGQADLPVTRTEHYEFHCNTNDVRTLAGQMEQRFAIYDQVFRFEIAKGNLPLRVRAYRDQNRYNDYVASRLETTLPGAVYLHHSRAERRELVICLGNEGGGGSLPFQAFLQFLRAFIPNPPAWIRDGFAVYFSTIEFDDSGELEYNENLSWLYTVKGMKDIPSPAALMAADAPEKIANFQALAWSLVSFFVNSGKGSYFRSLTESLMLLSPSNTAEENAGAIMNRIAAWNSMDEINADYRAYIKSRKSFADLITEGQDAYIAEKPAEAEAAFRGALELMPRHYAPWYYLGLLAYDSGDTQTAEQNYQNAMRFGADTALILYAMGINAAAAGKKNEAAELLRRSVDADPDYRENAETMIRQMEDQP
jgi:hypothetical protein